MHLASDHLFLSLLPSRTSSRSRVLIAFGLKPFAVMVLHNRRLSRRTQDLWHDGALLEHFETTGFEVSFMRQ
jgi:hypothetical protein